MMKPYAAIVRVSQMGGRKADSDNFHADEEQVREVERYAAQHGFAVEILPPELSISGGKPITERPSLKAAIEGVEQGRYAGIVAAYLSRLTRSRSGLEIWDRVEAAGGRVHAAQESLDTSTPNGRFVRDIHLANAVREREEKQEAWHRRRQASVDAGIWMPRRAPMGYDRGEDRRLTPNADAPRVSGGFSKRAAGKTISEVGRFWGVSTNTARWMLANRAYLGEVHDGDPTRGGRTPNLHGHPAIVDRATFSACQQGVTRPPRNPDLPVALLAGIVRCASCGYVMTRRNPGGRLRDGKSLAYGCSSHTRGGGCAAPGTILTAKLDEWIIDNIARPHWDELVSQSAVDNADTEQAVVDVARAERDAWIENVPASERSYLHGLKHRETALDAAEEALAARLANLGTAPISGAFDDLSPAAQNRWLRSWLAVVFVTRAGRGRVLPAEQRVALVKTVDGSILHGHGEAVAGMLAA